MLVENGIVARQRVTADIERHNVSTFTTLAVVVIMYKRVTADIERHNVSTLTTLAVAVIMYYH